MNKFKTQIPCQKENLVNCFQLNDIIRVIPMCNEKLEIQAPELLHSNPPAPANPGSPNELPFVSNFIKGFSGAFHLIILGIPILIFYARQTKKKNYVAH